MTSKRSSISPRVAAIQESATLAVTAKAKAMKAAGEDVVAFAAGEPDFDTPQFIKDAAVAALLAGDTKYTPRAAGALREAVASPEPCIMDFHVDREENVYPMVPAGEAINRMIGGMA